MHFRFVNKKSILFISMLSGLAACGGGGSGSDDSGGGGGTSASINSSEVVQGQTGYTNFQFKIVGENFSTTAPFVVEGCESQQTVSMSESEHIYTCNKRPYNPQNTLVIKSADGTSVLATYTGFLPNSNPIVATGITKCGTADNTSNTADCANAVDNATGSEIPKGQDGHYQSGEAMDYTILTQSGDTCVKDNVTGLIWEQKNTSGLRSKDHTYTWHSTTNNGGNAGTQNGGACTESNCDTSAYVAAVNAKNYCGYSDWRMPTIDELFSIVDYSKINIAINSLVFPHTKNSFYWSASPNSGNDNRAWGINFYDGNGGNNDKDDNNYVRLVRSGQ